MKQRYLSPKTITVVVSTSPILQGSKAYTDDPQSTDAALAKENPSSFNVWDDDWSSGNQ